MHIVKVGDDWKIINVLWELTPETWASRTDKARSSEPSWPRGHSQTADSRSTKADPSAGCPYRTTAIGRAKHGVVSRCHGSCLRNQPGKWSAASFTPASNDGGHHLQPIRAYRGQGEVAAAFALTKRPPSIPSTAGMRFSCSPRSGRPHRSPGYVPFGLPVPELEGCRDRSGGFCHPLRDADR